MYGAEVEGIEHTLVRTRHGEPVAVVAEVTGETGSIIVTVFIFTKISF